MLMQMMREDPHKMHSVPVCVISDCRPAYEDLVLAIAGYMEHLESCAWDSAL